MVAISLILGLIIMGLMPVILGVLIIAMLTGGGFALPFLNIPWYAWGGLLFILLAWIFK